MERPSYRRGANARRGEIIAELAGKPQILVLTLGALAELEDAFACENLQALTERFTSGSLSATDIIKVLGAGLRGGGLLVENEEVAGMPCEGGIPVLARLAGELLVATFAPETKPTADQGEHHPRP
ncbi:gene transfer agent family protein [Pseudovibrio sp. Tun.PSC04-5.I4]|uniref:gene transfer agent family protein n=1 Tax=Pseudovibrio sp. Tun.PSC04-5.I4 TaxID=1798213 RepID=UPI0008835DA9|nr:gene transfer agent family protein [Pseudovibrio sp. Tun.PSC04-5.I4]SDQ88993.1 Phage tail tube protein, GTA-gp10 [Pseudovibrio sp. Tun.PSC04-5.I4]